MMVTMQGLMQGCNYDYAMTAHSTINPIDCINSFPQSITSIVSVYGDIKWYVRQWSEEQWDQIEDEILSLSESLIQTVF